MAENERVLCSWGISFQQLLGSTFDNDIWKTRIGSFCGALFVEGCSVSVRISMWARRCGRVLVAVWPCLGFCVCIYQKWTLITGNNWPPSAQMLNQFYYRTRSSTTNSSVIKLMEISSSLQLTPWAFSHQSMVPRCENQSHGLLRYTYLSESTLISSVWMLWVARWLVQRGLGRAMFDTTTFGACADWCEHIESRCTWFGQLALRGI